MKTIKFLILTVCLILLTGLCANAQESKKKGDVYTIAEKMPQYPGGEQAMQKYLGSSVKYPAEAKEKGIQGKVYISFVVDEKGVVQETKVERSVNPLLDKEALRVVRSMPEWTPGTEKGTPVKVAFTLPINFVLDENVKKGPDENGVYSVVEVMPSFQGGDAALRDYIVKTVVYPDEAKKAGIQGKVYITFVIDETGAVQNAKVIRSVSPLLDKEAYRVVMAMPPWNPGKDGGKAVKVQFTIPVNFALK